MNSNIGASGDRVTNPVELAADEAPGPNVSATKFAYRPLSLAKRERLKASGPTSRLRRAPQSAMIISIPRLSKARASSSRMPSSVMKA